MPIRETIISPWDLYDQFIDEIPADITVIQILTDGKWRRVAPSEDDVSMAFDMNTQPCLRAAEDLSDPVGRLLRDIVALAKSWNFEDIGISMAAVNSYHSYPIRAPTHGFRPRKKNNWACILHPYTPSVAGKCVVVIGHLPSASTAMLDIVEPSILERNTLKGGYPGPACEYPLPEMNYVLISGPALVSKTVPCLLALASDAHAAVLGSPTPALPAILYAGVTTVISFTNMCPARFEDGLVGRSSFGMYDVGMRVKLCRS